MVMLRREDDDSTVSPCSDEECPHLPGRYKQTHRVSDAGTEWGPHKVSCHKLRAGSVSETAKHQPVVGPVVHLGTWDNRPELAFGPGPATFWHCDLRARHWRLGLCTYKTGIVIPAYLPQSVVKSKEEIEGRTFTMVSFYKNIKHWYSKGLERPVFLYTPLPHPFSPFPLSSWTRDNLF